MTPVPQVFRRCSNWWNTTGLLMFWVPVALCILAVITILFLSVPYVMLTVAWFITAVCLWLYKNTEA